MADPITNSVVGIAGSVLNKFVADKNLKMKLEHEIGRASCRERV